MPDDWDGVYKRVFRDFPVQALRILCNVDATGSAVAAAATEFTMKLRADGVFQVQPPTGDPLVVHVEVQRSRSPPSTAARRARSSSCRSVVPTPGRYVLGGLTLRCDVVDVTALDPEVLLGSALAPLAVTRHAPPSLVDAVVARIAATTTDTDARATLVDLAMLGADDELASMITDSIRRNDMSGVLERPAEGQALLTLGEARGEARAEARAEARGRIAGEAEGLHVLLAEKFGESGELPEIALALAAQGFAAGLRRIREADTLAELRG